MPSPHVERVVDYLWRSPEGFPEPQVYALLDAARSDLIFRKLGESNIEVECLYRGEKARELAEVAPYLVHLQRENPFTRWVLENGWGKSWGIFLGSSASLNELRRHFRTFLMVYDEEGTPLYFRYYDPRVLRVYLPTCNESELKSVFGPVEHYYVEGKEEKLLIEFGCNEKFRLIQNEISL